MTKIALAGAGSMARIHANAYSQMNDCELVGVFDVNQESAERLAADFGARPFSDFDAMLSADPEIVDICTPTPWHADYAVRAAESGANVLLEKPMALDVPTCERMIDAAESNNVKFMVAQVNRFFPEFIQAKRMVESGAVGTPAIVRASRGGVKPNGWFLNHRLSGGVIFDLMIHDIDWLAWTFGPVETVYAQGLTGRDLGGLDYALLNLTFKSGLIALVEGNWAYSTKGFSVSLEVAGDGGLITFDSRSASPLRVEQVSPTMQSGTVVPQTTGERDPYWSELRHFVDCVQTGASPSVSPHESLSAVRIACAAALSAKRSEPVRVGGVN